MSFFISLLAGCAPEYNQTVCPETGCFPEEPEDTATNDVPQNFPSLSGCDFVNMALPFASDASEDVCPLYYRGENIGEYDAACTNSLDTRLTAIEDAIPGYFVGDVSLVKLAMCQVPLTVFYEYDRDNATFSIGPRNSPESFEIERHWHPPTRTESARLYIAVGDQRDHIEAFENGDLGAPLPFANFFFASTIAYTSDDTVLHSSLEHGIADADTVPLATESNLIDFTDKDELQTLFVNGNEYAAPCTDETGAAVLCDYTLDTSGAAIRILDEDLTKLVRDGLLEVEEDETETQRGGAFFPPDN